MIHTRDNHKLVENCFLFEGIENFTGVVKDKDNTIVYYSNGRFDREDGPAIEHPNGTKEWYLNGKFHREDGPAYESARGNKYWYLNGKRHREDGPAVEYADDTKCWYLNDEFYGKNDEYTNESWMRFIKLQLLK